MLLDRLGCIPAIRLRAHSKLCNRGERGKFERVAMSLSVKSMDSWSYTQTPPVSIYFHVSLIPSHFTSPSLLVWCSTYLRSNTQVLDRWYFMAFNMQTMYQLALSCAVSVLFRDIIWAVGRTSEVELALIEWVEVGE